MGDGGLVRREKTVRSCSGECAYQELTEVERQPGAEGEEGKEWCVEERETGGRHIVKLRRARMSRCWGGGMLLIH